MDVRWPEPKVRREIVIAVLGGVRLSKVARRFRLSTYRVLRVLVMYGWRGAKSPYRVVVRDAASVPAYVPTQEEILAGTDTARAKWTQADYEERSVAAGSPQAVRRMWRLRRSLLRHNRYGEPI